MIARIVKALVVLIVLVVIAVGGLFTYARFHDGPIALIPGGPLVAGELVTAPVADWAFAKDVNEIEMQLAYEKSSRITWILVKDGAAYIPCSLEFPPGKRWHFAAEKDGAATVRIEGRLYPVTMVRVQDEALARDLGGIAVAKYMGGTAPTNGGGIWFFKLEPRVAS